MDKLIFYSPAPREIRKRKNPTIRISEEAFDLVEEISAKSGLTNSFVVSETVKFAAKKAVINYNDD